MPEPDGEMGEDSSGLFEIYGQPLRSFKPDFKAIRDRLVEWHKQFSFFVVLSAFLHAAFFSYVCFAPISSRKAGLPALDLRPFLKAMANVEDGPVLDGKSARPLSEAEKEQILVLLTQTPLFDPRLTENERTELATKLIESYFALKNRDFPSGLMPRIELNDLLALLEGNKGESLSSGGRIYTPGRFAGDRSPAIYKLPREYENQIRWLRRLETYEKEWTVVVGNMVKIKDEADAINYLPSEYYFRDCPYDEILARGAGLFYAVEGFPDLREEEDSSERKERLKSERDRPKVFPDSLLVYIIQAPEAAALIQALPKPLSALEVSKQDVARILDELMPLPEKDQFSRFADEFLEAYDPQSEDLAGLTGEFVYNNLSTVFLVKEAFPAAFDFVEELFYNKEYQDYLASYWRRHPMTETGSELLLILASLYDFEKRALCLLFDAYMPARDILSEKRHETDVFSQKAKAFVVKGIMEDLLLRLDDRRFGSEEALLKGYEWEQVKIFQLLVDMGGRPRNRALFAWGRMLWEEGRYGEAILKWRAIDGDFAFKTFQEIRHFISVYDSVPVSTAFEGPDSLIPEITRILDWESSENSRRLYKRITEYHKWASRSRGLRSRAADGDFPQR
jgi:hypothetical protein